MTVQECYAAMGGDYDEVMSRLRTEDRVTRFLKKVLDDPSYPELCAAIEAHDVETAFRAAHTLKGICLNLAITALFKSADALTDALRGKTEFGADVEPLFEIVKSDYKLTAAAIKKL